MNQQVQKGIRLPLPLVRQIEKFTERDGSTFSQFIRTAAIREVNRRRQVA